jgi:ferredoxin
MLKNGSGLYQKYAEVWPNIAEKGDPPADADDRVDAPDKLAQLSENAAQQ